MNRLRTALSLGTLVAVSAGACGFERLPPRLVRAEFPGQPSTFRCAAPQTAPAPSGPPNPFAFDHVTDPSRWKAEGVFEKGQPIAPDSVPASAIRPQWPEREKSKLLVPIGGSYWVDTPFPVARAGSKWVSSGFSHRDGATAAPGRDTDTGTLTSASEYVIGPRDRYLHFSIGGGADRAAVRLELQVRLRGATDAERAADRLQLETCDEQRRDAAPTDPSSEFATIFERAADGRAVLTPGVVSLGPCLFLLNGRQARIRIVDASTTAHISVADVRFSSSGELPRAPKVWGLADYHVHPAAHVGFGGLQGIHTIWGAPGRAIQDYLPPGSPAAARNLARDLPGCDAHKKWNGHHGGLAAPKMINLGEYRTSEDTNDLLLHELADDHGHAGAPSFADYPDFRSGAHQQHHITQIYRAYLGGLRLMSALAVHNQGLEYGMGWVTCGKDGRPHVATTPDLSVVEAHVEVMRELAALNSDWMGIAYTPAQARELIARNKLAVVLGVEVSQLGHPSYGSVVDQVTRLAELGIRQVTPIHAADNSLGGTAVLVDLYNSVNDWLNRPTATRDQVVEVSGAFINQPFGPHAFFDVEESSDGPERVLLRLGQPRRIVISDTFPHPGPCSFEVPLLGITSGCLHPFVNVSPHGTTPGVVYDQGQKGHVNKLGLTGRGREYIASLMSRGMLIDLAHMSDKSREQTLERSQELGCNDYPFMFSHAGFRQLPFRGDHSHLADAFVEKTEKEVLEASDGKSPDMSACIQDRTWTKCTPKVKAAVEEAAKTQRAPGSLIRGMLPKEFDVPTKAVDEVERRRGVVGVFLGQDPVDDSRFGKSDFPANMTKLPLSNDCAGSSKSFAAALLFANAHHPSDGVGIASDFVMHMTVAPRFGKLACALYLKAGSGSKSGLQVLETLLNPSQYVFAQKGRVEYGTPSPTPSTQASEARLEPFRMGDRTYDFNVDGLAHYGLLPDMLQDVKNVGVDDFAPLFRSAEGYLEMWERAWAAAGCHEHPEDCNPARSFLAPDATCGDACPNSWNGGAPLQSKKELEEDVCPAGEDIVIRGATLKFAPPRSTGQRGLLRRQGDWAVFEMPREQRVWTCGSEPARPLDCPPDTRYVKVRRVYEARVAANPTCDEPPGYPMAGSRRVIFQCLAGPPAGR